MGGAYSDAEKREFLEYAKLLDKAFSDNSYYVEFRKVRDQLVAELKAHKKFHK